MQWVLNCFSFKGKPTEKRKLNDADSEKQKGKQRKLDRFMFSRNN